MIETILVPLDESELSHGILAQVRRLLLCKDAKVELLRVVTPREIETRDARSEDAFQAARAHLARVVALLAERGVRASYEVLVGDPASRILAVAREIDPSLIAMASHGRAGISRWIRGSTAERVLRSSRHPVLLANPLALMGTPWWAAAHGPPELEVELAFRKILVPVDGSERSAAILPSVADLAKLYGSEVILLRVADESASADPMAEILSLRERLPGIPVRTVVRDGPPASVILDGAAEWLVDLVAMTTHGRSGVSRWAYGSVAEHVVRYCSSPLLVLRTSGLDEEKLEEESALERAPALATRAS